MIVENTVLRFAVAEASLLACSAEVLESMFEISDLRFEAEEGSTGGLEEVWARALASEKG
jgi:hypothetical protein